MAMSRVQGNSAQVQGNPPKIRPKFSKKIHSKWTSLKPTPPGDPIRGSDLKRKKKEKLKQLFFYYLEIYKPRGSD